MQVWGSYGYVTAQVMLPVENTGGTWVEVIDYESTFTIRDESGGIVESESFYVAAPRFLGPGQTGYLLGESFGDEHPQSDYVEVEADAYYDEAHEPEVVLTVENADVRRQSYGGLEVTGEIRNPGAFRVDSAELAALFVGHDGELLGFGWTFVDNIEPNDTRAFELTTSADLRIADIGETLYFASDNAF